MSNTAGKALREHIKEACLVGEVANAAGFLPAIWMDDAAPHVFIGTGAFINGRNRGRVPFIEIRVTTQGFTRDTNEGGTLTSQVEIICHDTGRDYEAVENRVEAILAQCLGSIRDTRLHNYTELGNDSMSALIPGPMGWQRSLLMNFEHSWSRDTYEATL